MPTEEQLYQEIKDMCALEDDLVNFKSETKTEFITRRINQLHLEGHDEAIGMLREDANTKDLVTLNHFRFDLVFAAHLGSKRPAEGTLFVQFLNSILNEQMVSYATDQEQTPNAARDYVRFNQHNATPEVLGTLGAKPTLEQIFTHGHVHPDDAVTYLSVAIMGITPETVLDAASLTDQQEFISQAIQYLESKKPFNKHASAEARAAIAIAKKKLTDRQAVLDQSQKQISEIGTKEFIKWSEYPLLLSKWHTEISKIVTKEDMGKILAKLKECLAADPKNKHIVYGLLLNAEKVCDAKFKELKTEIDALKKVIFAPPTPRLSSHSPAPHLGGLAPTELPPRLPGIPPSARFSHPPTEQVQAERAHLERHYDTVIAKISKQREHHQDPKMQGVLDNIIAALQAQAGKPELATKGNGYDFAKVAGIGEGSKPIYSYRDANSFAALLNNKPLLDLRLRDFDEIKSKGDDPPYTIQGNLMKLNTVLEQVDTFNDANPNPQAVQQQSSHAILQKVKSVLASTTREQCGSNANLYDKVVLDLHSLEQALGTVQHITPPQP